MTTIQPLPDSSTTMQPPDKQQYVDSIRGVGGDGSTSSNTTTTLGLTEESLLLFSPKGTTIQETTTTVTTTNSTKTKQRRTSMVTFANDVVNTVSDTSDMPVIPPLQPIPDDDIMNPATTSSLSRMMMHLPVDKTELEPIIPVSESVSPTSTGTGASSSTTTAKFQSKQLRGNLTRKQKNNRSPYTYYEVINVLGLGSMGSVAMVKKRPEAIGGSARKRNTTPELPPPPPLSRDDVTLSPPPPPCFQLPLLSPIIRWFHDSFHQRDGIMRVDSEREHCVTGADSFDTDYTPTIKIASSFASLHNNNNNNNDSHTHSSKDSYDMTYAMKSIHISRCTDPTFVEELQNEIQILKTLDHPHIEKVMEIFEHESQIFVILELCYGGDLYQRDPYTEDEAARITSSILSAISYMHSKHMYVYCVRIRSLVLFAVIWRAGLHCDGPRFLILYVHCSRLFCPNTQVCIAI